MIKNWILLLLLICLSSCNSENANTYEEGILNCHKTGIDDNSFIDSSSCLEGFHLPEFKSVTNNGKMLSTSDLMGKPTVINLWFIGCVPCELEIPGLDYLGIKYKGDVNFLAIGLNSKEDLDKYLSSQQKWDFTHINDPNSELLENVFKHEWGYPTTFIADSDGVIRKAFTGGSIDEDVDEQIIASIEPTLLELLEE